MPEDKPQTIDTIPTGAWSRLRATGRIAARFAASGASRLFGSGERADQRLGETILAELDQLKGMAMKVGQILSYMDVGLPPEVTKRMAQLQRGVQPMPGARIREVIARELGRPVEQLFARFDDDAIAAASIGQVHRARTPGGDEVVVKVRYPGIAETIAADFSQLGRLGGLAGSFTAVDGRALVSELHARVLEECDYELEARWQRRFAAFFAGDPDIIVPRVHPALCAAGVLTSDAHFGADFESFCQSAPGPARDRAARTLLRLAFAPLLRAGWLHADPHPGNQLYHEDGQVVALDYGCVRAFEADFIDTYKAFCHAVLAGDRAGFKRAAIALGLAPRPDRLDFDELWSMYAWFFEPLARPRFCFTREFWRRGRRFTSPSWKNARHQGFPPEWIWLMRVQWGLWALLTRLRARGEFAGPFRALLEDRSQNSGISSPGEARGAKGVHG